MPLNNSQRKEVENRVKQEIRRQLDAFQANYESDIRRHVAEKRQNGGIPVVAGMDTSKNITFSSLELASEINRQQGANPYLPADARDRMDYIANTALWFIETRDTLEIRAQAFENTSRWFADNNDPEKAAAANELGEETREELRKFNKVIDVALPVMRCLNGEVSIDSLSHDAKVIAGMELGTILDVYTRRGQRVANQPEQLDFVGEMTSSIDRGAFVARYRTPGANPGAPDASEREYAHASFGRAFNGIFGINGLPVSEDHPLFLGKFNHIFVDGKSVSRLCKDATEGMSPQQANDYMTMFTTATAIDRKSHIECLLPKAQIAINADGTLGKTLGAGRQPGSSVIPVISKVREVEAKPNWFMRLLNMLGIISIVSAQSEYEKMLANDPAGEIRRDDIEGRFVREGIQNVLEDTLRNDNSSEADRSFFHPDDLKKINPNINEIEKHFANELVGGVLTLGREDSRLSMVRLYMLSKGYGLDQILSPDESYNEIKREIGMEFYDVLHRGDPDEIGRVFVNMSQTLGDMEFPDIDFTNDAQLVAHYDYIEFLGGAAVNLNQSIPLSEQDNDITPVKAAMNKMIGSDGLKNIDKITAPCGMLSSSILRVRVPFIQSDQYNLGSSGLRKDAELDANEIFSINRGLMTKQSCEIANELCQDAKGKKLRLLDENGAARHMMNFFSSSTTEFTDMFNKGDRSLNKEKLDYATGKSLNNPCSDMRAKLGITDASTARVLIRTEAEAEIKITLPKQAQKQDVENIDIGALGQDAGFKSAPKQEGRDPLKPQLPAIEKSVPGKQ